MFSRALIAAARNTNGRFGGASWQSYGKPGFRMAKKKAKTGGRRSFSSSKNSGLLDKYTALLDSNPLATKAITSLVITAAGDVGCQCLMEDGDFDFQHFFIFSGMGLFVVGPTLHFWYGALNKIIPAQTTAGAVYRLAVDQTLFAMPFIATFMSSVMVLEGKKEEIPQVLKENWWPAVQTNWMLWVPANFLNFRFIQPRFQVLFANCVGFVWNTYLSFATHASSSQEVES